MPVWIDFQNPPLFFSCVHITTTTFLKWKTKKDEGSIFNTLFNSLFNFSINFSAIQFFNKFIHYSLWAQPISFDNSRSHSHHGLTCMKNQRSRKAAPWIINIRLNIYILCVLTNLIVTKKGVNVLVRFIVTYANNQSIKNVNHNKP